MLALSSRVVSRFGVTDGALEDTGAAAYETTLPSEQNAKRVEPAAEACNITQIKVAYYKDLRKQTANADTFEGVSGSTSPKRAF